MSFNNNNQKILYDNALNSMSETDKNEMINQNDDESEVQYSININNDYNKKTKNKKTI